MTEHEQASRPLSTRAKAVYTRLVCRKDVEPAQPMAHTVAKHESNLSRFSNRHHR